MLTAGEAAIYGEVKKVVRVLLSLEESEKMKSFLLLALIGAVLADPTVYFREQFEDGGKGSESCINTYSFMSTTHPIGEKKVFVCVMWCRSVHCVWCFKCFCLWLVAVNWG